MSVKAVVRMRSGFTLALILLSGCASLAQQNPDVQVRLSLANGKDSYRGGEPIVLELTFTATAPGYQINEVTTEPASPVDQVLLSPAKGVYSWLDDYSRERRYSPDYSTSNELQPGQPVTIELPLNALYRFDEPGRYTVHAVTSRISSGDFARCTSREELESVRKALIAIWRSALRLCLPGSQPLVEPTRITGNCPPLPIPSRSRNTSPSCHR